MQPKSKPHSTLRIIKSEKKSPLKGSQRKRWGGSQLTVNKIPEGCILMKHFAVSEIIEENPTA